MKLLNFIVIIGIALMMNSNVSAADLQTELSQLKEDVMVLQRQMYRGVESVDKSVTAQNSEVQVKIGQYDETIRALNGRLDEMDYKIKQNSDKLDKMNRDIEIRFKILEGRQIPANLSAPAPKMPVTYSAPVADSAAPMVAGEKIKGDDLAPIGGMNNPPPLPEEQPQNLALPTVQPQVINANNPDDMYNNAIEAYNNGFYDEAELAFEDILKQFPNHRLASNAQYWLGEVYTKQGNLNKAQSAFKEGYEKYKNGNKAPDSLYRLGMTLESLNEKQKACIVFLSFADEFPKANADLMQKTQNKVKALGCK